MPILNIRDMGMVGVNSDIAPWELPPAALSAGVNFRMSNGKIQSAGGIDPVGADVSDEVGHIASTRPYSGEPSWIACGENDIQYYDNGNWVSKKGSLSFADLDLSLWSSCSIGNVVFLNHPDFFPVYWTNNGDGLGDFELLPWNLATGETWQSMDYSCEVLCAHKNFLMALGMREGADEFGDKVWWSHPAEPNGIPPYWDTPLVQRDSIAGNVSLGKGGKIIGGESLRDSFVIYSEESINTLDYTGDAIGWRRRTVSSSADLIAREGVVEIKGQHFFIGRDDIMAFDGNSMQSIVHQRIKTRLAGNVNTERRHKSWAVHYESYNEVWFAVPTAEAEYPDLVYAYNYRDNTWSVRSLQEEFPHGAFGPAPVNDPRTWDSIPDSWDEERGTWAMGGGSPFAGAMLGASGSQLYDIDPSVSTKKQFNTVYKTGESGTFSDWSTDGSDINSDETRLMWRQRDGIDIDAGLWAEINTLDYQMISVEPSDTVRVIIDASIRQEVGSSTKIEAKWNGVTMYSEPVIGSSYDTPVAIQFDVAAGDAGDLRLEISEATEFSQLWGLQVTDVKVEKINLRESTVLYRSDIPVGGHEANTTITRVYPLIEGTSPVEIRVGSAQRAGGPVRWAGDFRTFIPGQDRKIDVRSTGETHAYEIRSSGTSFFDITGMDIEFSMAGQR